MTTSICKHCDRGIQLIDGAWVDPEATGDDSIWRETCGANETFTAEHEPAETRSPAMTTTSQPDVQDLPLTLVDLDVRAPHLPALMDGEPVALYRPDGRWYEVLDVINDLDDLRGYMGSVDTVSEDEAIAYLENSGDHSAHSMRNCLKLAEQANVRSVIRCVDADRSNENELHDHWFLVEKIAPLRIQVAVRTDVDTLRLHR